MKPIRCIELCTSGSSRCSFRAEPSLDAAVSLVLTPGDSPGVEDAILIAS